MASPLPPEQQASYSAIIDDILARSDLNTISAKAIRKGLQEKVDYDLTPQKGAIKDLIMERFDKAQGRIQENGTVEPAPTTTNGVSHVKDEPSDEADDTSAQQSPNKRKAPEDDEEELSDVGDSSPAPKKAKKSKGPRSETIESDEQLAARIQAELNAGSRSTRGGGAKRKTPTKKEKKTKKKSSTKISAEDDSDIENSTAEKPEKEKKGGFHKPMNLSEPLSAMLGETQLSRPQTVKKIWEYVKSRDLQDPSDKRQIICDEAMRAVFKGDKIHMFTMNKVLANHLYPVEDLVE